MTDSKTNIDEFRLEVSTWLDDTFPSSLAGKGSEIGLGRNVSGRLADDSNKWREQLASKGWGAPTWPVEYGGAGLSQKHAQVISDEMEKNKPLTPFQCWLEWA